MFTPTVDISILLATKLVSFAIQLFLLCESYKFYKSSTKHMRALGKLAIGILCCSSFLHLAWALKLIDKLLYPKLITLFSKIALLVLRLEWVVAMGHALLFCLLLENLVNRQFELKWRHRFLLILHTAAVIFIVGVCILYFHRADPLEQQFLNWFYKSHAWYILLTLASAIWVTLDKIKNTSLPRIVREQTSTLLYDLVIPNLLFTALGYSSVIVSATLQAFNVDWYLFFALNDLILLAMLFFCIRKILGFRFLNTQSRVREEMAPKVAFIERFNELVIKPLAGMHSVSDFNTFTGTFFAKAFHLYPEHTTLYMRAVPHGNPPLMKEKVQVLPYVERWIDSSENKQIHAYMGQQRILVYDELAFDYFYNENPQDKALLDFLDMIHAEIFIPIYDRQEIIAYIVVQRGARPHKLFSDREANEMCIFAHHVGSLVNILHCRNLIEFFRQEREWDNELYGKQQEINHCKESMKTLLQVCGSRTTGMIQFNRKKLRWVSEYARTLFEMTPDMAPHGMPHADELKAMAEEVVRSRAERHIVLRDSRNRFLHCSAAPCGERTQVIITVHCSESAENFAIPFDRMKDVASWEYALYLETTATGRLINQLVPSSTAVFLNFKIDLLKISLSKRATLLELPEADLMPVVRIIHYVGLRSKLHICHLTKPEQQQEVAQELFGTVSFIESENRTGLLTQLEDVGTLFIQNVECLSMETQERLAACIATGSFQPVLQDRAWRRSSMYGTWQRCTVRIICSTLKSLPLLVEQGKFSPELFAVLRTTAVALPSLSHIPAHEIAELARQIAEQAIQSKELRSLLSLTNKETGAIMARGAESMQEFKADVCHVLQVKSHRKQVDHVVKIDQSAGVAADFPPEVAQAIKLGKKALRDRRIMHLLWETFQSQAKIATLLNVNRSSVNRRCKEFNLSSDSSST